MERPHVEIAPKQREVTGEIVYLDKMRRYNEAPQTYSDIGEMAIELCEQEAGLHRDNGTKPDIMNEYDHYDVQVGEAEASCQTLADELLKLKEADSPLTFVDIAIDVAPDDVLGKLKATNAGNVLTEGDEQLAIESNGEHYPVLDIQKQNSHLIGVGVRAWGWNDAKYVFTNEEDEPYKYPQDMLMFPSDETASTRQIELTFGYVNKDAGQFTESVSLWLSSNGSARISSNVWVAAYAETGYEGHHGKELPDLSEEDVIAFGDLIAEIVGDEPESIGMRQDRQLQELTDSAASPEAQQAIQNLIEATWPAQAVYILSQRLEGSDKSIGAQLLDKAAADTAVNEIDEFIQRWQQAR